MSGRDTVCSVAQLHQCRSHHPCPPSWSSVRRSPSETQRSLPNGDAARLGSALCQRCQEAHRSLRFHLSRPQRSCRRALRPLAPGPWLPHRDPRVRHRGIIWRRAVAHIVELPEVPTHRWRRCYPCRSGRRLRGTLRSPRWRGTFSRRSPAAAPAAWICNARSQERLQTCATVLSV